MKPNDREVSALSQLPGKKRYEYFIKKVADWENAWGLNDGGWALYGDERGHEYFPLWPAEIYAQKCASGEWSTFTPKPISLERLRTQFLRQLSEDGVSVSVFMVPENESAIVSAVELLRDLNLECEKYE